MGITTINNGDTGLVVRTAINDNFTEVYNNFLPLTGGTTTVRSNSANWNSVYSSVNSVSANWNSVYTSTRDTSGNWNSVYNTVNPLSSNWDSVYSNVQSNSANAISVYSTVNSLSSNWNSVYTNVNSNSASYVTNNFVNSNFVPISGGTITGNLSVLGNVTYLDTAVQVTSAMYIDTASGETALRITQRGPGDVIRVEDSDNPDSSPFIVNSDGLAGFGTTAPNEKLTVVGNVSATGSYYGNGSNLSGIVGNGGGASSIRVLTQAEYNAIAVPVASTIYIITP